MTNPWTHWRASGDVLDQFTIFQSPLDAPGMFVVRRFEVGPQKLLGPTGIQAREGVAVRSLEEARALIPIGLVCLARSPEDHPSVVETWT